MAILAFSLFWILVAVGLTFIALSGGPAGARERLHVQSRRAQRFAFVAFGLALAWFAVGIPAVVTARMEERASIPEANVSNLTAEEKRGRVMFGRYCNQCHTLKAAAGTANVGPNLDTMRPTKGLVLDAIENGRARGNGAMAADLVEGRDAEAVASFVAKAVGQAERVEEGGQGAGTP